ncbi:MAG: hypothetical protein NT018_06470 [Armatimonadetes bacterium]|nr:hypothetical protein [Armatimonadota bacterium]
MRKKKIPGQSLLAQRAHFLKGGPMERSKAAKAKRRRKANRQEERQIEKGNADIV